MTPSLIIPNVTDLDLAQTLDCGQSFRWTQQPDGSFSGVAFGRSVNVSLDGSDLIIHNASKEDEALWRDYFDLALDYGAVRRQISKLHPVLKEAAQYAPGIRILRQEPYEALCTFIISQNNNIKRIKGIVSRLCECFGEPVDSGFAFPTAVASGEVVLENCRSLPYEEAQKELMKITGVGVKVADCTLLFGLHRIEAFPVDVWMKRALDALFPGMSPSDFGEYAGIAQQYIFHYSRMHPELFAENKKVEK